MVWYLSQKVENSQHTSEILGGKPIELRDRQRYADPAGVDPRTLSRDHASREAGYRMDPNSLPKKVLWRSRNPEPLEILPGFVVNERFMALVEEFEPSVHQFVPVELYRDKTGQPTAGHYWFVVCQRAETVDPDRTTLRWNEAGRFWSSRVRDMASGDWQDIPGAEIVYSRKLAGGRHIWVDPTVLTHADKLCSDEFAQAAREADFRGLAITKRQAV